MMNGIFTCDNSNLVQIQPVASVQQMGVLFPQQQFHSTLIAQPGGLFQTFPYTFPIQNANLSLVTAQPQTVFPQPLIGSFPVSDYPTQQYFQVVQTPQGLQAVQIIPVASTYATPVSQVVYSQPGPEVPVEGSVIEKEASNISHHVPYESDVSIPEASSYEEDPEADSEADKYADAEECTEEEIEASPEDPLTALTNLTSNLTHDSQPELHFHQNKIDCSSSVMEEVSSISALADPVVSQDSSSSGQGFQVLIASPQCVPLQSVLNVSSTASPSTSNIPHNPHILTLPHASVVSVVPHTLQKVMTACNYKPSTAIPDSTACSSVQSAEPVSCPPSSPQLPDSTDDLEGQATIKQSTLSVVDGVDLEEIREFAKNFKMRRLFLGLTQSQVGLALSSTQGPAYSQSAICRFEKLDITPKSAAKMKPVLEQWLQEAEGKYQAGHLSGEFVIGLPDMGKVRKKRTFFSTEALVVLNTKFHKCAHPTAKEINSIAAEIGYDRSVVRVWFCNKRQALRNSSQRTSRNVK